MSRIGRLSLSPEHRESLFFTDGEVRTGIAD